MKSLINSVPPIPDKLTGQVEYAAYRAGIEFNHIFWLLHRRPTGYEKHLKDACSMFSQVWQILCSRRVGHFLEEIDAVVKDIGRRIQTGQLNQNYVPAFLHQLDTLKLKAHSHHKVGPQLYALWNVGLLVDMTTHPIAKFPGRIQSVNAMDGTPPVLWTSEFAGNGNLPPTPLWPFADAHPNKGWTVRDEWLRNIQLLLSQAQVLV